MNTSHSPSDLAQVLEALERVEASLARHEERQAQLDAALHSLRGVAATAAEIADDASRRALERGVDPAQRVWRALSLLELATSPERLDRLEALLHALDALPGTLATAANVADDWAAQLMAQGVDLHQARQNAQRLLVKILKTLQSERAGDFDMLSDTALDVLNRAGRALSESMHEQTQGKAGVLALWRASRDPHIQRALDFGVRFGARFGQLLVPQLTPSTPAR